jgi:hypothetical protein
MKLRIKGNSLRFRLGSSELAKLVDVGRIEETIYFAPEEESRLVYGIEHRPDIRSVPLLYRSSEIAVSLRTETVMSWAEGNEVGIYALIDLGTRGQLQLLVEKDFACLDLSETDNSSQRDRQFRYLPEPQLRRSLLISLSENCQNVSPSPQLPLSLARVLSAPQLERTV